jgi:hypothetical protein
MAAPTFHSVALENKDTKTLTLRSTQTEIDQSSNISVLKNELPEKKKEKRLTPFFAW